MKTLVVTQKSLSDAGRWDIDFHLPAELIRTFPEEYCVPIRDVVDVVRAKRDPTKQSEKSFWYIDIASLDVASGRITNPQELIGEEELFRARKVVHAYDIVISTVRSTRRAVAVVPESLHGEICSTGSLFFDARKA